MQAQIAIVRLVELYSDPSCGMHCTASWACTQCPIHPKCVGDTTTPVWRMALAALLSAGIDPVNI